MRRTKTKTTTKPSAEFKPDAYVVRTCGENGESYNGWRYPMTVGSVVECPDWNDRAQCGGGFHGLLDGIGDWSLVEVGPARKWQVFHVMRSEVVVIDDAKVKFPRGLLVYVGNVAGAMTIVQPETIKRIQAEAKENTATGDRGHAAATGDRGHAAATGDRGHAAATGDRGHAAATGDRGHAAATGNCGHAAATGDRGHAAATGNSGHAAATGYSGHAAATGDCGHAAATGDRGHAAATGQHSIAASLGYEGTALAGPGGWLVLAQWGEWNGMECPLICVKTAKVGGPEGIKPNVAYRLNERGDFIEDERR